MGYERTEGGPLDTWLSAIEDTPLPEGKKTGEDKIRCDFCSSNISHGSTVTHYGVDEPINPEASSLSPEERNAPFGLLRVYCEGCDRKELRFPCAGYHEVILQSDISEEGVLREFKLLDFSPASDGVPWSPNDVWEVVHGKPFLASPMAGIITVGPEDIADDLASNSIDVADIVDEDGNISVTEDEREELRERVEKTRSEP
jgi:hypothetical protein